MFFANGGRLEIVTRKEAIDAAVRAVASVYCRAERDKHMPTFTEGLLRTYAAHGGLRLGLAWLGEVPIAAQIWIVAHGRAFVYAPVLDRQFQQYATDRLITLMLSEHVSAVDNVVEVDYLEVNDAHGHSSSASVDERRSVSVHNASSLLGMARTVDESTRRFLTASKTYLLHRPRGARLAQQNFNNPHPR
jgi:hypothetical protein